MDEKFTHEGIASQESPAQRQSFDRLLQDNGQQGYSVYSLSASLPEQAFRFAKPCKSMILQLPQILRYLLKIPNRAAVQDWHGLCISMKQKLSRP